MDKKILVLDFHPNWSIDINQEHLDKISKLVQNLNCDIVFSRTEEGETINEAIDFYPVSFSKVWDAPRYKFEKICAIIFFIEEDENVFDYIDYVEAKKAGVPIRLIKR